MLKNPNRREILSTLAALPTVGRPPLIRSLVEPSRDIQSASSKAIARFHESLSDVQRNAMCFDWDHKGPTGMPLRLHVTNNWAVSSSAVASFSKEQQVLIEEIFRSVLAEGWTEKLHRQAKDDTGRHWTEDRKVALFGKPGSGRCQCVISGFHLTFRAVDGQPGSAAFGGALSHGHQPSGFNEKPGHPGNIFWYQARQAHEVFRILSGKQQQQAVVKSGMPWYQFEGKIDRRMILPTSKLPRPLEPDVRFRGEEVSGGLPVAELSADQKEALRKVLDCLLEPYRPEYRQQVLDRLKKQGGLEKCSLAFYEEHQVSKPGEWDNWRLEGPSFIWFYRGSPHVHIWIHVADDPATPVTSHFG